jgi:hypothetical protein
MRILVNPFIYLGFRYVTSCHAAYDQLVSKYLQDQDESPITNMPTAWRAPRPWDLGCLQRPP